MKLQEVREIRIKEEPVDETSNEIFYGTDDHKSVDKSFIQAENLDPDWCHEPQQEASDEVIPMKFSCTRINFVRNKLSRLGTHHNEKGQKGESETRMQLLLSCVSSEKPVKATPEKTCDSRQHGKGTVQNLRKSILQVVHRVSSSRSHRPAVSLRHLWKGISIVGVFCE